MCDVASSDDPYPLFQDTVDNTDERIELRADRRPRPDITRWHRIAQHLPDRARVDPKTTRRFALAQTLNHYRVVRPPIQFHSLHPPPFAPKCKGLSLTEFCSGATRLSGRFSEGLLLRRSQSQREHQDTSRIFGYLHASDFIAQNMSIAPSIDNFLHTHGNDPKVVQVGKLLIVRSILDAERKSTLYVRDPNNQDSIDFERGERSREGEEIVPPPKRSWLGELFRLLVAEKEYADFYKALQNIAFVSFNYDRCIEQYLLYTARQYFRLTPENVADLNSVIEVIHPYGSIGELNVQGGTIRGFGKTVDYRELIDIADGIRTFTEQIVEKTERERIFERFHNCQVAIFLGFAFLPLNMKLLFGDNRF